MKIFYTEEQRLRRWFPAFFGVSRAGVTNLFETASNCLCTDYAPIMRRATSLIQTSEIKILLSLPSIILFLIFVNVKTLIMLMLFLEQARGRPTWSLWKPGAHEHHVGDRCSRVTGFVEEEWMIVTGFDKTVLCNMNISLLLRSNLYSTMLIESWSK